MIAVVTGTPLGEALARRLVADGREVTAAPAPEPRMRAARLVVVDARPAEVEAVARALGEVVDGNQLLCHSVRGLCDGMGAIEVLRRQTAALRLGVLAGPLAEADLVAGRPTAAVVASRHPEVVEEFAAGLSTTRLRVYRGRDPLGVELASGLGDLVALGLGLTSALGFSATTHAVLLVRAVRELGRLIGALGGDPATASGLAGLGDLLVRGADRDGEPFRYGAALVKGPAPSTPQLASLAAGARTVRALARQHHVRVHIFEGLAALLDGTMAPAELVGQLMALPVLDD
jgi:glycerol-3-phosphate dehydrogenase (NAD(P)+)